MGKALAGAVIAAASLIAAGAYAQKLIVPVPPKAPEASGDALLQALGPPPAPIVTLGSAPEKPSFSAELGAYPVQPTSRSRSAQEIFERTKPDFPLDPAIAAARLKIVQFYKDNGFDISLTSQETIPLLPQSWSKRTPEPLAGDYRMPYSVDSPFYQRIPKNWPKLEFPVKDYFQTSHISTLGPVGDGSFGYGIGLVIGRAGDPVRQIERRAKMPKPKMNLEKSRPNGRLLGLECPVLHRDRRWNTTTRIPDAENFRLVGNGVAGVAAYGVPRNAFDRVVIWIDDVTKKATYTWRAYEQCDDATLGTRAGDWTGDYIVTEQLPGLGDRGGVNAANMADLPKLIRPGELTNPNEPIRHVVGGPSRASGRKLWKAAIYPGRNWDHTIDGFNGGLIPYGMLLQLDPSLDLQKMYREKKLSLPAFRLLEAMQNYGWMCDDSGRRDMDFKGQLSNRELEPYGGRYGVSEEVINVVKDAKLYIVAPLVKRG
ncbi:MAG: hypothetical protein KME03_08730 [Aphanocapsa lilacina HA4352-LM1]|jgi:hypothetical protein|nr:hypothetical protein [Aphanocapsa lilacina HA4352-LM1]